MDHPLVFPIILQLVGIVIVMVEIIVPSGGLLALLAAAAFGYSLYSVFTSASMAMGLGFVLADVIMIPIIVIIGFKALAKSPVTLRKILSSEQGVSVQQKSLRRYLGMEGVAITDLRPSGIAIIAKERLDVVTEGKYLAKDAPLIVVSVTGNQIIVREKKIKGEGL
ncbi:NfeD family protein [bacterium]|nr:NfeD family protein [bacterium]